MATTILRTRVETGRAAAAREILAGLGLDPTAAVNMFFAQVISRRGIPFDVQETGYAYAAREYGIAPAELDAAEKRIRRRISRARAAGALRTIKGPDDLL